MRIGKIVLSIVFVLMGCSENENKKKFDQTLLLKNLSENFIIPAYQTHLSNTSTLKTKTANFAASISNQTLIDVRQAWLKAALSWKHAEIFNFGPVDDLSVETSMDFWPTSTTGIENSVTAYDGSSDYIDGIGSNKKGIPAIEYLLFHADTETILAEFGDEKRQAYLVLLANDLSDQIEDLLARWVTDYADEFVANTGTDSRASAVLVSNQMLMLVEDVKNYKVGTPFGLNSGNGPLPELVESPYAGNSLEMIRENIDAIELVFTGGAGMGFDDYLDSYPRSSDGNEPIAEVIKVQIKKCKASSAGITVPLEEAISTQSFQIEQLLTDLSVLNAYLKTDMMTRLGLVITFTDNDGD